MSCSFLYADGSPCDNECHKNLRVCKAHRYYKGSSIKSQPLYNAEPEEVHNVNVRSIPQAPPLNETNIADTPYNRWFIKQCVERSSDQRSTPAPSSSMISEMLPMVIVALLPFLKQFISNSNLLQMFKQIKGISPENLKPSNINEPIRTTTAEDLVPIIQEGNTGTDTKEHKG